jgi:hypothetical protein
MKLPRAFVVSGMLLLVGCAPLPELAAPLARPTMEPVAETPVPAYAHVTPHEAPRPDPDATR